MLQELNQNQKPKVTVYLDKTRCSDIAWWRTWTSSWWANVYF